MHAMQNSRRSKKTSRIITGWRALAILTVLSTLFFIGCLILSDLTTVDEFQTMAGSINIYRDLWIAAIAAALTMCALGSWLDSSVKQLIHDGLRTPSKTYFQDLPLALAPEERPPCFLQRTCFLPDAKSIQVKTSRLDRRKHGF